MLRTGTIALLVLAIAGAVLAVGLPLVLQRNQAPAEYVADQVATTQDIQQFDLMWDELEVLQKKSVELGPQKYKQQFLDATAGYLQLDDRQSQQFEGVVNRGLDQLAAARERFMIQRSQTMQDDGQGAASRDSWSGEAAASVQARRNAWSQWRDEQRKVSDVLLDALQSTPRHNLLAERRLLWFLKLDFSLRKAENNLVAESSLDRPTD